MINIIDTISKTIVATFKKDTDAIKYMSDNPTLLSTCGIFPDSDTDIREDDAITNCDPIVLGKINLDYFENKKREAREFREFVSHLICKFDGED